MTDPLVTPDKPGRAGVVVIRVEDIGLDGEGFTAVLRAVEGAVPDGAMVWGALADVADRILAEFAPLAPEPSS